MQIPYFIIVAAQIFCIIHVLRKNKEYGWIFLILFVPLIGSIIYILTQVVGKSDISSIGKNLESIINPTGKIKDLEKKVRFSDTYDNKVQLADAYLSNNQVEKAIELYKSCLTGIFKEDPYVLMQLSIALFEKEEYETVAENLSKIRTHIDFVKSRAHLVYAKSLEKIGAIDKAEVEFNAMKGSLHQIEFRYEFGQFLIRLNRPHEAKEMYEQIISELEFMDKAKRRRERVWITKMETELSQLETME